jgi:NTP pyrophosphatase (non-canonical NTP hydrolase)
VGSGILVRGIRLIPFLSHWQIPPQVNKSKDDEGLNMNFTEYQTNSRRTARYPSIGHPVVYPTLGLANEAGEVAGKIKKIFRDKAGVINAADRVALNGELGDVLWYLTQVCTELGISLEDVAEHNLEKLFSRLERGKIGGEGDER